jgi:3-deoxy-D-manno-octulosonic-acid transferase
VADEGAARGVLRAAGISETHLVILGGSTWPGEERELLRIFAQMRSHEEQVALVLVPRHAERREKVTEEIRSQGFTPIRRTELNRASPLPPCLSPPVLLVDTTGELRNFYACADIIFVGKSLTQTGGQNIIEPALYGKPIVVGPHMENFPGVMEDFLEARAIRQVADADELGRVIQDWHLNVEDRLACGRRAARLVRDRRGALSATAAELDNHIPA